MTRTNDRHIRVAIAQTAPVFADKQACMEKALSWIQRASKEGASLVAFGETWVPGYPVWLDVWPKAALWNHAATKNVFATLRQNSITVPGPEVMQLIHAATKWKITITIGINERVDAGPAQGTLFNTLLTIAPNGSMLKHRKLVPTFSERMVWGQSNEAALHTLDIGGVRVGGLICWEHWMPLARMAMHVSGEHIHIAAWPTVHETHQLASRHYAFEGRCFVLAAGSLMRGHALPEEMLRESGLAPDAWLERGGSCIIAPNGEYIVEPVFEEETLLMADLDLREIDREVMTLDVTGHYARPDLFTFEVKP